MKPSEVIKKYGWCQGTTVRGKDGRPLSVSTVDDLDKIGGVCLYGAVCISDMITGSITDCDEIRKALEPELPALWNDTKERTKEEVIALLESINL